MKFNIIRNILVTLSITFFAACEEVIDIDLNSSNPVLVAEGAIDNGSPAWIRLTYTSDYFNTEQSVVEENAIIEISDNEGNSEILEYISDGMYQGRELTGIPDNQYLITVLTADKNYEATSSLFHPSEILSVSFEKNENVKPGQDESYVITLTFKDDTTTRNYYLIKFLKKEESEGMNYYLVDNSYYKKTGEIEYSPFRQNFESGDEVIIELYSIDKNTYIYYSELNDIGSGNMMNSSTPYNPKSNFGSEVMGYFTAWSKVEYYTVVE